MAIERHQRARKRKHVDYKEEDTSDCEYQEWDEDESDKSVEEEEEERQDQQEALKSLAETEASDLDDLISIASEATEIVFDNRTGRPVGFLRLSFRTNSDDVDDDYSCEADDEKDYLLIDGLVKVSNSLLLEQDRNLFRDLTHIHSIVKKKVQMENMVPWAGIGGDSTRLRSFGFMGKTALNRLDRRSTVRLYAPEKSGEEALTDERANRKAICVLNRTRECVEAVTNGKKNGSSKRQQGKQKCMIATEPDTVNPTLVADKLCAAIIGNKRVDSGDGNSKKNRHLNSTVLCSKELIAYQTNLHNGAKHLAAHLDAPLHEGFGKVIVTVAIRGSATILLIGKSGSDADDDDDTKEGDQRQDNDNDESSDLHLQPAWKFHLKEGDAYVLSGNARNVCLHAVLANDDGRGGERESLNLRFGLHSIEEAEQDILRHWPDLW